MSKAIYAFSGDPPTFGHLDIIKRVSSSFDHVVVGIGVNPNKKYMYSLEKIGYETESKLTIILP